MGCFCGSFGLIFGSVFFAFLMTLAHVGMRGVITTNLCKLSVSMCFCIPSV